MTDLDAPDWWGEGEAETTRPFTALLDRLNTDLDTYPDSPTIAALVVRDRSTGAVIGSAGPASVLGVAYLAGAPAYLIVRAERLAAAIGDPGRGGHVHRAVRLDALRRDINRRLRPYVGRNALGTITVRLPLNYPARADVALPAVLDAPERAEAVRPEVVTDADPPPLDAPDLAPLLRTGPPTARVSVAA